MVNYLLKTGYLICSFNLVSAYSLMFLLFWPFVFSKMLEYSKEHTSGLVLKSLSY